MSHSQGIIFDKEKLIPIAYYEYNGTVDICISHLYQTMEEVNDNWRKSQWLNCHCKQEPISCYIYSDYGSGYYWEGEVCIKCRAITNHLEPDYNTEVKGRPDNKPTNYAIQMGHLEIDVINPKAEHPDWN